jgi:hypothetical protein
MLHAAWLASSSFGLVWPTHSCSGGPAAERSSCLAQSPTTTISPPPFRTRWHWHQKVNFFYLLELGSIASTLFNFLQFLSRFGKAEKSVAYAR